MTTTVVNKRTDTYDVYIGRGSIFGNPYTHLNSYTLAEHKVASRDEALEKYGEWFREKLKDPEFRCQVKLLRGKRLGCFCKPLSCHGDIIAEYLNGLKPVPVQTYKGWVTKLEHNQVFVFGSNLEGFHGAGSAGYASFGVPGNRWREFEYDKKPNGWRGKWNVKGIGEGFQGGTEGWSYALPTVKRAGAKRSRKPDEIQGSIKKLYEFANKWVELDFFVAQENKMGLNGYGPEEMAEMFMSHKIPPNVFFEESFAQLLVQ